jgi:MerR family transcriptional regulator, copper efflux regulator
MIQSHTMTIGHLSRRTGVPIKVLRTYEDLGFLCTRGRSESNYRLFGEEALRCVQVVQSLRSLGLTLKEIQAFIKRACQQPGEPVEGLLQEYLAQTLARIETQISSLQARRQRILEFQTASVGRASRPAAPVLIQMLAANPRCDTDHFSS